MKKVILILIVAAFLFTIGCSKSSKTTAPDQTYIDGSIYQRPEFVDTRPVNVIEKFTLTASNTYLNRKKKPDNPGGGNGGGGGETPADPNPNPAHKYAYIIGISDYDGTQNDLQYCDDDAIDWKNYLQTQGFTIHISTDQQATANNIAAGLQWLVDSAAPGDEIAFIYSGHGTKSGSNGSCIISSDLYYLTHDYVMEYISAVNTTKKMLAIDACMVGDFHDNATDSMIIATASDGSYSYDGESWMQNGVWTYYYIEALVNNGMVFNEDAMDYAKVEMKLWGKSHHVRVTPKNTDLYIGFFDI